LKRSWFTAAPSLFAMIALSCLMRLSQRKTELRAAGRRAYYDGVAMDRCPVRLREAMLWRDGWLSAQREVDDFIAGQIERASNGA
jgi:hypothetical protein